MPAGPCFRRLFLPFSYCIKVPKKLGISTKKNFNNKVTNILFGGIINLYNFVAKDDRND